MIRAGTGGVVPLPAPSGPVLFILPIPVCPPLDSPGVPRDTGCAALPEVPVEDRPPQFNRSLALHPLYERLLRDVERLRTEVSLLLLEHDELLYHECKEIESAYMLHLGGLEYRVYELDCAVRRARLKAELIQARINRQEPVDLAAIARELESRLAEHQAELDRRLAQMNAALERSQQARLGVEDSRELRRLYRAAVRALHPDLNPDLPPERLRLFLNAVAAYERGDLQAMRAIEVLVGAPDLPAESPEGLERLTREKERLTAILGTIRSRIADIKAAYPYSMKAILQQPEEVEARQARLREQIRLLGEAQAAYDERIRGLLGSKPWAMN